MYLSGFLLTTEYARRRHMLIKKEEIEGRGRKRRRKRKERKAYILTLLIFFNKPNILSITIGQTIPASGFPVSAPQPDL